MTSSVVFATPLRHFLLVLKATFMRQFLELVRYPVNAFFWMALPVVWNLPMYFLIVAFAPNGESKGLEAYAGTSNYFTWYLVGMITSYILMDTFWSLGFLFRHLMMLGVLETIWTTPCRAGYFLLSETLYRVIDLSYGIIVTLILTHYLYRFPWPTELFSSLIYWLPFLSISFGIGVLFAAYVLVAKDPGDATDIGSFLVDYLSGSRSPPQALPKLLFFVSMSLPLTYAIDLVRVKALAMRPLLGSLALEVSVVLSCAVVIPIFAFFVFQRAEKYVRRRGLLVGY